MFEEAGEVREAKWDEWILLKNIGPIMHGVITGQGEKYPILKFTEYPSNPLEKVKEKLESISCLAAEGPEVESHAKLFDAIVREALKALAVIEGKKE